MTSAIASATSPEQLSDLLGAVDLELDETDLAELTVPRELRANR